MRCAKEFHGKLRGARGGASVYNASMKLPRALLPLFVWPLILSAQSTVTDNFSGNSGLWEADVTAGGGAFAVSGGVLNFTSGALLTGNTASAQRDWTAALSAGANWSARVDLGTGATMVAGQITSWTFVAAALTNPSPDDYLSGQVVHSYQQDPFRTILGTPYTNGVAGSTDQSSANAAMITFLFSFDATTHLLTLSYDTDGVTGADNFTTLTTVNTATAWGLTGGDTFGLRLMASNVANAMPSSAFGNGFLTADNFSTSAAVPEPSTYAVLFGTLALLATMWRRRALNNAPMR